MFEEIKEGVRIHIYVQPNGKKTEILGEYNGSLKIRIHAPPVDGKANDEIIRFISKELRIPKSHVSIIRGELSRNKVVEISGMSLEKVESTFLIKESSK